MRSWHLLERIHMGCSVCKRKIKVVARGLCRACYTRWHKRGTTDYAPKRERQKCQIPDCDSRVVSHGLCDKHRLRLRDHGHTEGTRPDSWGAKSKHPLYYSWQWMRRHNSHEAVHEEWLEDFLQFATDVGDRPSSKHKLYRADDSEPLGPENFVWKLSITQKAPGEDERTYQARHQRVYRALRPEMYRGAGLKKRFGMSNAEYESMDKAQSGVCAICKKPETMKIRGKLMRLAVDHCHKKGHVRALLCSQCNQGLGCFKDDPKLLMAAAKYVAA